MNEIQFRDQLAQLGCTEVREVQWEPHRSNPKHAHDYTAHVLILDGEFILGTATGPRSYAAGESFVLDAGIPHTEATGAAGARFIGGRVFAI